MGRLIDKRILFVHIPKTAGTFLNRNFSGNFEFEWENPKHVPLYDLYKRGKQEGIDVSKLYTISLVRNPWSKQYSTWSFFKQLEYKEYFSGDADIDNDFNYSLQLHKGYVRYRGNRRVDTYSTNTQYFVRPNPGISKFFGRREFWIGTEVGGLPYLEFSCKA